LKLDEYKYYRRYCTHIAFYTHRTQQVVKANPDFSDRKSGGSIFESINLATSTRLSLTANYVPGAQALEEVAEAVEEAVDVHFEHVTEVGEDMSEVLRVEAPKVGVDGTRSKTQSDYKFDKVFTETSGQQDLFDHLSGLVTSCIDGYNVTVFGTKSTALTPLLSTVP
jgi:hypothetical protein